MYVHMYMYIPATSGGATYLTGVMFTSGIIGVVLLLLTLSVH